MINSPHSNGIWDFSVNADRWAELPDDNKSILETNMREVMIRSIINAMRGDEAVMKKESELVIKVIETHKTFLKGKGLL